MIGVAAERVEQLGITSCLVVGDGGFHQVAGTVHFVPVAQILPAHFGLDRRELGIEITIRLLRPDDQIGHLIDQLGNFRIGLGGEDITRRLQPLRRIRVAKDFDNMRRYLAFKVQRERLDPFGLDQFVIDVANGHRAVGRLARGPKGIIQLDLGEGNGGKLAFSELSCHCVR